MEDWDNSLRIFKQELEVEHQIRFDALHYLLKEGDSWDEVLKCIYDKLVDRGISLENIYKYMMEALRECGLSSFELLSLR